MSDTTFSKRHYTTIASILSSEKNRIDTACYSESEKLIRTEELIRVVSALINMFAIDNIRFIPERFADESGVEVKNVNAI